jgi:hypothetical protein
MSASREDLQLLLLAMLAPAMRVEPHQITALDADDWAVLQQMVRDHRIGPMLHWQTLARAEAWPIPEDVAVNWLGGFRRAALRILRIEQTLLRVSELLDDAGIAYAALKGAALAWEVYPNPGLRTMRDLDILVAREDARRAYDILHASDFRTPDIFKNTPEYALAHDKHFPPLFSPVFEINVELHFRLTNHIIPGTESADYHHPERLLAHRLTEQVRDRSISVLCPSDTLLHVIVHAAYDHGFANGPLVLTDIAHLIAQRPIDWTRFWALAAQGRWSRGCQLMFDLVAEAHGHLPEDAVVPGAESIPQPIRQQAKLLTLCKMDEQQEARIIAFLQRPRRPIEWLSYLYARIFAPRHLVASWGNVERNSIQLLWLYPLRALFLIRKAVAALMKPQAVTNADQAIVVADWLHTAKE